MKKVIIFLILIFILPVISAIPEKSESTINLANGNILEVEQLKVENKFTQNDLQHYNYHLITKLTLYDSENNLLDKEVLVDQSIYLAEQEPVGWNFQTWTHKLNVVNPATYVSNEIESMQMHSKYLDWEMQFCKGSEILCVTECVLHPWAC